MGHEKTEEKQSSARLGVTIDAAEVWIFFDLVRRASTAAQRVRTLAAQVVLATAFDATAQRTRTAALFLDVHGQILIGENA